MNNLEMQMILDDGGFSFFLQNIKGSKLKTALKAGLRKSLNIIKKQALSNLKSVRFKKGTLDVNSPVKFKNSQGSTYTLASFKKGIMTKVFKDGSGGRAEIIGKGKDYNLILPMIQNAKGPRETKGGKIRKKGHPTGSIGPHNFFSSAVDSTKQDVQSSLQKNLEDAINRAKDKFYK